jgi:phytoene desaturase
VTVPQVFEELWAECGRDFHADVDLRPVDPYYEIRWRDGSTFTRAAGSRRDARGGAPPVAPRDVKGYRGS